MADPRIVYEPSAQRHRVANFAPSPDPQRPGRVDLRVIVARCGMVIALVGLAIDRRA